MSDGTLVMPLPGSSGSSVVLREVYARGSPLRPGDVVYAVGGVSLNDWVSGRHPPVTRRAGQVLDYRIVRHGMPRTVAVQLVEYPFGAALDKTGVLLGLVVFLLAVVGAVFLLRPFDPAAQAMFLAGAALPLVIPEYPLGLQVIDLAGGPGVTCECRKPMSPGDTHESRLRRGHAGEHGSGLGR